MMRPGFTTATQYSGAPLPFPIRVSAGFLVTGLSGKMRIQTLPPRLTNRVIAIRPASICRSVIHAASSVFKPKSPNSRDEPRHALPRMRPRCCLRYFTFVDPALHTNDSVGRVRLCESVVDVGAQRVQRHTSLEIPFRARDFGAVQ